MINRIPTLERRTRSNPHDPAAWCDLAEARLAAGQRIEALSAAEAAAQTVIETADLWIRIGDLFRDLALPDHARQMYLDACGHDRASAVAHARLGESLLGEGAAESAASRFATAVWLAPDAPAHRLGQARALIALEAHEEACEHLALVTEAHPTTVEAWSLLADLHLGRGDSAQAFAALGRGQAAAPDDRVLGLRLARLLLDAGFTEEALTTLNDLSGHHKDAEVLDALADAQTRAGDRSAAIDTIRQIRLARREPRDAARLGTLLAAEERYDEAVPLLREAALAPEDEAVFVRLGRALLALGRVEDALDTAEDGIARFGDSRRLSRLVEKARAVMDSIDMDFAPDRSMDQSMGGDEAFAGSLRQFKVPDLLEFLRMNQRTGVLRLISSDQMGEIQLFKGKLASATTSGSTRLGERLLAGDHITAAQLEAAIQTQQASETLIPLGEVLVDSGTLTTSALRPVLEKQILQAVGDVLGWPDGRFAFDADDDDPDAPAILFDTGMMMLDAFRLMDEAAWADR